MLPFGTVKLTSRSTTCSSNANETRSNATAGEGGATSKDLLCSITLARGKISAGVNFFGNRLPDFRRCWQSVTGARLAQSAGVAGFGDHPIAHIAGPAQVALPACRSAAATATIAAHVVALMLAA